MQRCGPRSLLSFTLLPLEESSAPGCYGNHDALGSLREIRDEKIKPVNRCRNNNKLSLHLYPSCKQHFASYKNYQRSVDPQFLLSLYRPGAWDSPSLQMAELVSKSKLLSPYQFVIIHFKHTHDPDSLPAACNWECTH